MWDTEKFRLRRLVEKLIELDEVEIHDNAVALADVSRIIEATPKAVLFRDAGPQHQELVASVGASRSRLAVAFGVPEGRMREEYARRLANPKTSYKVPASDAPVQEVVTSGNAIDLTKLPFHVQHEYDGAPYISSGIDYTYDPATKRSNVGCRRLMLRDKDKLGFNITHPGSDLRKMYLECVERGEKLPMSFTIGAHPLDMLAAFSPARGEEIDRIATLRGEALALVKCLTNDVYVPADAEIVLEGYIDERGFVEQEGPYGEYMGYYGPMHDDPLFHVTAITHRRDVLHQTVKHGVGKKLSECDSGPMSDLMREARAWELLHGAGLDPAAVYSPPGPGAASHLRVAIRPRMEGDARAAIAVILENIVAVKHVYLVDEDVDVRSTAQMEWAMSTRFQADRDLIVMQNMASLPMDISAAKRGVGAKAGFDCCVPFPRSATVPSRVAKAPTIAGPARFQTLRDALENGPAHFAKLMSLVGSRDGRELVLQLEQLRNEGVLNRSEDGDYVLKKDAAPPQRPSARTTN